MRWLSPKYACQVAAQYKRQLHRFLLRRLDKPNVDDLARELVRQLPRIDDLAREVYLRLPRIDIDDTDYRRNPLGYVHRVAADVLDEWNEAEKRAGPIAADREQIDSSSQSDDPARPDNPE